ncbi:MAG: methionyl-tRNA formyltransferase [Burkholderiales bacterium]|jgi:methionyl-tRNA formyltransferase|nr:methionyl-tRNA formyltransferase [Burkholderiales bacterium]
MRIVFAGTPEFAVPALAALVAAGETIVCVLTQPDRPSGRGLALAESPVKRAARGRAIDVFQPQTLRDADTQARIAALAPDLMVVAAYGLILPRAVLDIPRLGAINIHASLLPRWRGAAPIQRAILAGDGETGISIMLMEAGLDTGPVLLSAPVAIEAHDTAGTVHDELAALGGRLIVEAVARLAEGPLAGVPQPAEGVTYAAKIEKREARIDWARRSAEIDCQIRAFDPVPGAFTTLDGAEVKIWRARPLELRAGAAPGTILRASANEGLAVACGEGALALEELQKAGGKRLAAPDFLRGTRLEPGRRFGA